jgi:hypothetical protein
MPIISARLTVYRRDGTSETLPADQARYKTYVSPEEWSLTPPPPAGWARETPRYRVTRDLLPAQKARFRLEPPFSETWQSDVWQYGDRPLAAGEEIETTAWPHPSMRPLTYSAERTLAFFKSEMKSRLPTSPWHNGAVRLDNGLSGPTEIDIARRSGLTPTPRHPGPSTDRRSA